jgi:exodeoxyribonuclease VIII
MNNTNLKNDLHLSIDIETLGNTPMAPVIQIGAVLFDLENDNLKEFQVTVSPKSISDKFKIDADTIYWWFEQSKEAQNSITDAEKVEHRKALEYFRKFIQECGDVKGFWSHATFDVPILNNNCTLLDIGRVIPFRQAMDIRTLNYLAGSVVLEKNEIAHNALSDARYQAKYIRQMLLKIS